MKIHPDFSDFISALKSNHVEFVMVGAFDLAFHGHPRYTGDMDIWVRPSDSNAIALIQAIKDFGLQSVTLTEEDILSGHVIQLGYPPVRIDLITILDGLTSEEIWSSRQEGAFGKHTIFYLGKDAFIKNKRAIVYSDNDDGTPGDTQMAPSITSRRQSRWHPHHQLTTISLAPKIIS